MNNEEKTKQAWQPPEIIDLDVVNKTEGKTSWPAETNADLLGPS